MTPTGDGVGKESLHAFVGNPNLHERKEGNLYHASIRNMEVYSKVRVRSRKSCSTEFSD